MVSCDYIERMKKGKSLVYSKRPAEPPSVLREGATMVSEGMVTVRDAKAHLSALLDWVAGGHALTITSDGKPKARLVSVQPIPPRKVFQGMGNSLLKQPVHGGSSAEELIREDRDGRGW